MEFRVFDLGLVDFQSAWDFQKKVFSEVRDGSLPSGLILCQHHPVLTLGRAANPKNILLSERELKLKGIAIYKIERGGEVTYHGPGQLSVYPIFNLSYFKKDIHFFLRYLEEVTINLLADFGVSARQFPGRTGVWVEQEKIASIGIAIRQWISFHGLSINLQKEDLENFRFIRPCGMDIQMTCLETVLGRPLQLNQIKQNLISRFSQIATAGCLATCCF
jgi:lipoate-protein ligase B